jgi:hypothetical protein
VCVAGALCVWMSVCMFLFDFRERRCAGSERALPCRCVAVCVFVCVCLCVCVCVCVYMFLCGTALHGTVAAADSSSSHTAAVAIRRSVRHDCGAVSRHVELLVHCRRIARMLCARASVCVSTPVSARLCVYSTSRLSNVVVFCMGAPSGIHSVFADAVLLLLCAERLFARAWCRCASRCDLRDRRSVVWWEDGVRYPWAVWLCRLGVTRTRCCA